MKKKIMMALLAVCMVTGLAACTRADKSTGTSDNLANSSAEGQNGTVSADGSGSVFSEQQIQSGEGGEAVGDIAFPEDVFLNEDDAGDGAILNEDDFEGEEILNEDNFEGEEILNEDNFEGEEILDEGYDGNDDDFIDDGSDPDEEDEYTGWVGTYVSETLETLHITILDEENLSFVFENSGISGAAELDGDQAIFRGDDQHVVVFELQDDQIKVSVLSEEDFDTSESVLNGEYVRVEED